MKTNHFQQIIIVFKNTKLQYSSLLQIYLFLLLFFQISGIEAWIGDTT